MTEENISEMNLKGGWQTLLSNPLSLPLKLRGRRWGLWLVMLFFFLLPWQTRYIFREAPLYEWGTLSIYSIEILGWAIIILFAFLRRQKFSIFNFQFTILGLILLAFSSILWAPDKLIALQAAIRLLQGILLYFVIRNTILCHCEERSDEAILRDRHGLRPRDDRAWILYALISGAVIQALLGTYQFLTQSSFASTLLGMALHDPRALGTVVVEFGQERWLRAYGSLPHPNVLGGYLVIALAALVLGIRNYELGIRRCVWWGSVFILLTGIFFTFSRAAWIATGIILMIGLIRQIGQIGRIIVVGWIVALIVIYWPLVTARVMPVTAERLEIKSRVERVEGLKESWALIKTHPLLGVGIGNYTQSVQRDIRPGDPLYSYQPVHNVFLLILAELGVVGLLLFLLALFKIFKRSSCYVLCVTCIVILLFDHYLWSLPFGILLFWGTLSLSTALLRHGVDKKPLL